MDRKKPSSWAFCVVLVAVAVQATTPDRDDLVSSSGLRLISATLGDLGPTSTDDESPDEVCAPARPQIAEECREASHRPFAEGWIPARGDRESLLGIRRTLPDGTHPANRDLPDCFSSRLNC